jgi:DNA-binding response OmpR family regulator
MSERRRVLIIDDDPLFRGLVNSLLSREFDTQVADDGADGYRKALAWKPHLALIDVRMPGWDGLRTLQSFRTQSNLQGVKTIMLTGDASRETVLAAIRQGVNDYIVKSSFTRDELWRKVRTVLGVEGDRREATSPPPLVAPLRGSGQPDPSPTPTVCDRRQVQEIIDDWE